MINSEAGISPKEAENTPTIEHDLEYIGNQLTMSKDELSALYALAGDSKTVVPDTSDSKRRGQETFGKFHSITLKLSREFATRDESIHFSELGLTPTEYREIHKLMKSGEYPDNIELSTEIVQKVQALAFPAMLKVHRQTIERAENAHGRGFYNVGITHDAGAHALASKRALIAIVRSNPYLEDSLLDKLPFFSRA